jgi:hypothetical protein
VLRHPECHSECVRTVPSLPAPTHCVACFCLPGLPACFRGSAPPPLVPLACLPGCSLRGRLSPQLSPTPPYTRNAMMPPQRLNSRRQQLAHLRSQQSVTERQCPRVSPPTTHALPVLLHRLPHLPRHALPFPSPPFSFIVPVPGGRAGTAQLNVLSSNLTSCCPVFPTKPPSLVNIHPSLLLLSTCLSSGARQICPAADMAPARLPLSCRGPAAVYRPPSRTALLLFRSPAHCLAQPCCSGALCRVLTLTKSPQAGRATQ